MLPKMRKGRAQTPFTKLSLTLPLDPPLLVRFMRTTSTIHPPQQHTFAKYWSSKKAHLTSQESRLETGWALVESNDNPLNFTDWRDSIRCLWPCMLPNMCNKWKSTLVRHTASATTTTTTTGKCCRSLAWKFKTWPSLWTPFYEDTWHAWPLPLGIYKTVREIVDQVLDLDIKYFGVPKEDQYQSQVIELQERTDHWSFSNAVIANKH